MKTLHKNFRHATLIAVFMLIGLTLFSQSYVTVSGILRDSRNRDRIANANITVPGLQIGTVSNSDGGFSLKIPTTVQATQFEVSHISYITKRFAIAEYINSDKVIQLDPQVIMLSEIQVIPDDARSIVSQALHRVRENYSRTPNMMTGFYRESIRQRRDYISISEAVVEIYKASYQGFQGDQVRILKGRKGVNVKKADTMNVQLQGGPQVLLWLDIAKNPESGIDLSTLDNYMFEFSTLAKIDDKTNYVIDFKPQKTLDYPLYYGKLFIEQQTLAITRAEFSLDISDPGKAAVQFVRKKPMGSIFEPTGTSYLVTYKPQGGKYYLNYMRVDLKFRSDWKRRLFKNNYTIISELAITDRKEQDIARIPGSEQFKSNMIMSEKVASFQDPLFWGEHNIIEPEEAIENAIKRITRRMEN